MTGPPASRQGSRRRGGIAGMMLKWQAGTDTIRKGKTR